MKDQNFRILYLPIGVGTYHMETAHAAFEASRELLLKLFGEEVTVPEDILFSPQAVKQQLSSADPDLVILQSITFANAAYMAEALRAYEGPLALWTLREPVGEPGGRLKLNSLTGTFSAANTYHQIRQDAPLLVFGGTDEPETAETLLRIRRAAMVKKALRALKIAQIGHTPEGFGFGRGLDAELQKTFGAALVSIEARELIKKAEALKDEDVASARDEAASWMKGLDQMPAQNVKDYYRLQKAYQDFAEENHIGALSSRCWPDFFVEYGTPVCSVLSVLNAIGIPSACEADTYGALSMWIGQKLSGEAAFFGDPVALSEEENTLTFWHCGMAACSLAKEEEGACVGVHPNRKIGPTMEFGTKACEKATILRIGKDRNGAFRLLAISGEVLDKPRQFLGTSCVVRLNAPVRDTVANLLKEGWEPHYAVIFGDVAEEIRMLGDMLQLPVTAVTA
ncbi:MAG: fucose isomerase [Firmicutes bacterium]|nr:fucose isomerase [Bacillota bacterium]